MFQEQQIELSVSGLLNKKFPDAVKVDESYSFFTSAKEEFDSLRNGIGLRINLGSVVIQLSGKDVLDFLHRVSTNSVKDLKTFEKRNTIFLNEKGRFIDRTTLIKLENDFFLIGSSNMNNRLLSWVNKFIIAEDIQTKDVSKNYSMVDFIGPQAESYLTLLIGKEINSMNDAHVRRFDVDGFTFFLFMNEENNGVKIYRALIDSEKGAGFIEHLFNIKSVFDLRIVGDDAYDAFRVENGIPASPNEINDETNPHEVNLLHEVNFKKGCYIGQEIIARLDTYDKVQKKLCTINSDAQLINSGALFLVDREKVEAGKITTLLNSELLNGRKGLAIVRKKIVEADSAFILLPDQSELEVKISEVLNK